MSVWFCIPSARTVEQSAPVFAAWHKMGYKIAIVTDDEAPRDVDLQVVCDSYPGYANSVNYLAKRVLAENLDCDWIVCGGDDTYPDPNVMADEIADQCNQHFGRLSGGSTFGVMQPTGHRWGNGSRAYIDRICGSPWLGREWCLRAHQGNGPMHHGFFHMHVDEALQELAVRLGVLWQRPDLTHFHEHWMLKGQPMPKFLERANSREHWNESSGLLQRLRDSEFRECMPI